MNKFFNAIILFLISGTCLYVYFKLNSSMGLHFNIDDPDINFSAIISLIVSILALIAAIINLSKTIIESKGKARKSKIKR